MRFEYQTRHIPTGTVTKTAAEFSSDVDFLRFLNKWNTDGDGWYVYTAVDCSLFSATAGCSHNFKDTVTLTPAQRDMDDIKRDGGYWQPVMTWVSKDEMKRIRTRTPATSWSPKNGWGPKHSKPRGY